MSLEQRSCILGAAISSTCGVRELVRLVKLKTSNVVSLLRKMNEEQLIEMRISEIPKKGRPKQYIEVTPLGCEFLDAFQKLKMKPLRARKEDLKRAAKDARYAKRLVENGLSPFQIFMELNFIASNIKDSSENH